MTEHGAKDVSAGVPISPAVGAEVRVEWGVEYEVISGGTWRQGYVSTAHSKADAEWKRDEEIPRRPRIWRNPHLVRRTITTYADGSFLTSAWQPVSDQEGQA